MYLRRGERIVWITILSAMVAWNLSVNTKLETCLCQGSLFSSFLKVEERHLFFSLWGRATENLLICDGVTSNSRVIKQLIRT